jgi:hypothetical protein
MGKAGREGAGESIKEIRERLKKAQHKARNGLFRRAFWAESLLL